MQKFSRVKFQISNCVLLVFLLFLMLSAAGAPSSVPPALGADLNPPEIINVKITELASTSVAITWETDEDTDALINYDIDKKYCTIRSLQRGKTHRIELTNLDPSTIYYFRTISNDLTGNQAVSEDYVFKTQGLEELSALEKEVSAEELSALQKILIELDILKNEEVLKLLKEKLKELEDELLGPPNIIGKPRITIGYDSATIEWLTDKEANSMVALVPDSEYDFSASDPYAIYQGQPNELVLDHSVMVIGLKPSTLYHFQVVSEPAVGPTARSDDDTFTTKAIVPEIVAVSLDKVEEDSATISWKTTIPSSGVVEYTDTYANVQKSVGDPTFLTAHTVRLNELTLDTVYSAVVVAENNQGEQVKSDPITFRTVKDVAPPVISKVKNESTLYPGEETRVQTIISWETDEQARCQLFYHQGIGGAGAELESLPEEPFPTTRHVQVVTSFTPATVYKFWVECFDRADNKAKSEDFVMFTPQKEKSIIDIIIENFESSFGWVKKVGK